MITAASWYDGNPDTNQHYQGDIVRGVPFPTFPASLPSNKEDVWPLLRPVDLRGATVGQAMRRLPVRLMGRAAKDVTDAWTDSEGEWVAAHTIRKNVMIISRSCALDNPSRKHTLIAPVISVATLPPDQRKEDKLAALRQNEIPHFFYLPLSTRLEESYADLLLITPVHRSFLPDDKVTDNLVVRLSSLAMGALQSALSDHFGQKFGFDVKDTVPQDGVYACFNCFWKTGRTEPNTFPAGRPFGDCTRCGDQAAWIKLRI